MATKRTAISGSSEVDGEDAVVDGTYRPLLSSPNDSNVLVAVGRSTRSTGTEVSTEVEEYKKKYEQRILLSSSCRTYCDGCIALYNGDTSSHCVWEYMKKSVLFEGKEMISRNTYKSARKMRLELYTTVTAQMYGREAFDTMGTIRMPVCVQSGIHISFPDTPIRKLGRKKIELKEIVDLNYRYLVESGKVQLSNSPATTLSDISFGTIETVECLEHEFDPMDILEIEKITPIKDPPVISFIAREDHEACGNPIEVNGNTKRWQPKEIPIKDPPVISFIAKEDNAAFGYKETHCVPFGVDILHPIEVNGNTKRWQPKETKTEKNERIKKTLEKVAISKASKEIGKWKKKGTIKEMPHYFKKKNT